MNKKLKILFGISLAIILVFFMGIHLFANELPSKNASFTELMNFAKGHMEVTDNLWKDVDEDLAKSWYNTTKKQKAPSNGSGVAVSKTKSFYEKLYKNKVNERKELQQKVTETGNTLEDMKTAYKNIPDKNADANEIDTFIKSDAKYNDLKNLRKVEIDKAKKWRATINDDMIDTISRQLYNDTLSTLDNYINGGDVDAYKENLSNKLSNAESATEKTLNEYKKKLMLAKMDEGDDRTDDPVNFVDVLDDVNLYKPGGLNKSDSNKFEKKVGPILGVITNIGMLLSIIMPAILGIKYMLGSLEEKAEYKKDMIPYLVGAVLLFGICLIVKIVQSIGNDINSI